MPAKNEVSIDKKSEKPSSTIFGILSTYIVGIMIPAIFIDDRQTEGNVAAFIIMAISVMFIFQAIKYSEERFEKIVMIIFGMIGLSLFFAHIL